MSDLSQGRTPEVPTPPGILVWRVRGVPVYLGRNWPFIVLIFLVIFNANGQTLLNAAGSAVLWGAVLLLSVILHEVAHSLAAQWAGFRVRQIVCDVWGGHTSFLPSGMTPGRSALVGLAGPLANGVVAAAAYSFLILLPGASNWIVPVLWLNLGLFVFNVLPGLPLDGGQVVSAIGWKLSGNRTTGLIVGAWAGRVVTALVIAFYLLLPVLSGTSPTFLDALWGSMIGFIMWRTTSLVLLAAKLRRVSDQILVRDIARPTMYVPGDVPLPELAGRLEPGTGVLVGGADGRPLGLAVVRPDITFDGDTRLARDIARPGPDGWVTHANLDEPVSDLMAVLQLLPADVLAVEVAPGQYGLLWRVDLERAFEARRLPVE